MATNREYVRQVSFSSIGRDEDNVFQEITDFNAMTSSSTSDDALILNLSESRRNSTKTDSEIEIVRSPDMYLTQYDLDDSWEKLGKFETYRRSEGQGFNEFISVFDSMYRDISMKGMTLSSEMVAYKLLKSANVSKNEMIRILRQIDYSKLEDLYDKIKEALSALDNKNNTRNDDSTLTSKSTKSQMNPKKQTPGRFYMILDSACSGTVCGKKWLDRYLNSLDAESKKGIVYTAGTKTFVFGGGEPLKSVALCRIPAQVAGRRVMIETDVVHSGIPLIYSLSDMKKSQVILNFNNDTAQIYGEDVRLNMTPTGHYCVPIDRPPDVDKGEGEEMTDEELKDSRLQKISNMIDVSRLG